MLKGKSILVIPDHIHRPQVRVVGTGCFLIHKERGFSGENFLVQGSKVHDLRENGHDWSTVK